MRLIAVLLVALAGVAVAPVPATAQACRGEDGLGRVIAVECAGESRSNRPTGASVRYEPEDLITAISEVDGRPCTIVATITSGRGQEARLLEDALQDLPLFGRSVAEVYQWIVDALPACASAAESPATVAWSFVRTASPPESRPHVAPGFAITGRKAYLETQGPTTDTQTFDTLLGPLAVRFEAATMTIDWGDGSGLDRGPFAVPSKPYPEGTATHVYTDIGTYDVVVSTAWLARWSVGGESGTLGGLTRVERIEAFEVRQLQAVRDH